MNECGKPALRGPHNSPMRVGGKQRCGLGDTALPAPCARSWPPRSLVVIRCAAQPTPDEQRLERAAPIERTRSSSSFVRPPPIISYERTRSCSRCGGGGAVPCAGCAGLGKLPAGGYHARNPVSAARILASKWTAMERTLGWRHFRVTQKQKEGKETFVCMVATCDENAKLWINIKNLKDRALWAAGWLQRTEMRAREAQEGGAECRTCHGAGTVACPLCSLAGEVVEL